MCMITLQLQYVFCILFDLTLCVKFNHFQPLALTIYCVFFLYQKLGSIFINARLQITLLKNISGYIGISLYASCASLCVL